MRGAQCDTDHIMVKAIIRSTFKPIYAKKSPGKTFNITDFKTESIRKEYGDKISYNPEDDDTVDSFWKKLKRAYIQAAERTLSKRKSTTRDWFDESDEEVNRDYRKKTRSTPATSTKPYRSNTKSISTGQKGMSKSNTKNKR